MGIVKHNNFGDDLNIYLLENLSGAKIIVESTNCQDRLICAIGSIIDSHCCSCHQRIIWGTGSMSDAQIPPGFNLDIRAVRGPLTRNKLVNSGYDCPQIYGDPALLLPLIYSPVKEKKYNIGIIPHVSDLEKKIFKKLKHNLDNSIIINFKKYKKWRDVIDLINSCELIISSSLHGLIISDAYNVPNVWISDGNGEPSGGGNFKFRDYFLAVHPDLKIDEINPYVVNASTSILDLKKIVQGWKPIKLDLYPLINACPFKIKGM